MQKVLPTASGGKQPLPEGLMWLLLTGEVPQQSQVDSLSATLRSRSKVPEHVHAMLRSLPAGTHPMTQLSMAVLALQPESLFAKAYAQGAQPSVLCPYQIKQNVCSGCVAAGERARAEPACGGLTLAL